jgi:hypothetical protein
MKPTRQVLMVGSAVWALVGALVALPSVPHSTPDGWWLVALASVLFPAAAAAAAVALRRGATRFAGVLLLVSVATPTYFAWALNVPALVAGLVLTLAPSTVPVEPAPRHN